MAAATLLTKPFCGPRRACAWNLNSSVRESDGRSGRVRVKGEGNGKKGVLGGLCVFHLVNTVMVEPASSLQLQFQLHEPPNALSFPTWAIHVSSVAEWIIAMALVWQYADKSGYQAWKGLSWGMVPLLGGAFCACTWHFFYNSESLEVLVALQAALTVVGNATMCIAAYRIYKSTREGS